MHRQKHRPRGHHPPGKERPAPEKKPLLPAGPALPKDRQDPEEPTSHPRKRPSGTKEEKEEPRKRANKNKSHKVRAFPEHSVAKNNVINTNASTDVSLSSPVPAGSRGHTHVAQASAPKEQEKNKNIAVDVVNISFPSVSKSVINSKMLLDSGALNGVNVISTKLATALVSIGLATPIEGDVASICGCFHTCKVTSNKICFSLGFLSDRLDENQKQIEKQISLEAYVVDTGIADLIVGRESIKTHSLVKWLPTHFYKISQETADAYGLDPMVFGEKSRSLDPTRPEGTDYGTAGFHTDVCPGEGTTSESTAFPAVHTSFPEVHTLPVSDPVPPFPGVHASLPSQDETLLLPHGVRESVRTAGSGLAKQGSVAL